MNKPLNVIRHDVNKISLLFRQVCYLLVCFDLLIVVTPFKIHFPWTTQMAIVGIAIILLLTFNFDVVFKDKYIVIVILCYGIFLVFGLFHHGPSINEYLYRFSRLLPLFFAGIMLSQGNSREKWIVRICFATLLGVFWGNISLVSESGPLVLRSQLKEIGDMVTSWSRYIVSVLASLIAIYLYQYYNTRKSRWKYFVTILFPVAIISVLRSGFTASIISLFIGLSVMGVLTLFSPSSEKPGKKVLIVVLYGGALFAIYYALINFAPDSVPTIRIQNLIDRILGDTNVNLEYSTGLRTYLGAVSWSAFLSSPVIGIGSHSFIYGGTSIGAHSTILDMLAQFGLIGGIPVIVMLLSWLFAAIKIYQYNKSSYLGLVLSGWWLTYLVGCIMNPYLFSGALDHYVFTFAGITVGLAKELKQRNDLLVRRVDKHFFFREGSVGL